MIALADNAAGWLQETLLLPALYALGLMEWEDVSFGWALFAVYGAIQVVVTLAVCMPLEWWRPVERWPNAQAVWVDILYTLIARVGLLHALATLPVHPESVPINALVQIEGTPQGLATPLDPLDFVRTIAVARITMPKSMVRLSAGREAMNEETQALCFLAGANSIFYGPRLLTTPNPVADSDRALFGKLGLTPMPPAQGA